MRYEALSVLDVKKDKELWKTKMAIQHTKSQEPNGEWIKAGDLNMYYLDWSQEGESVITLHGAASSCHWYDLVMPYIQNDFRLMSIDQRGHGKTDQLGTGYDWATLSEDIINFMDQLELSEAHIVGHSWGASVALNIASRNPSRVLSLTLIDGGFSASPRSDEMTWEDFKYRLRPRDIYGDLERYIGILRNQFMHCWTDKLEHILMTMVRQDDDGSVHERLKLSNQQQMLWAMWSDPTYLQLPLVKCPTLLVPAGGRSVDSTHQINQRRVERVEGTRAMMDNCVVEWIENTGHDIGYEQPEQLAHALERFFHSVGRR